MQQKRRLSAVITVYFKYFVRTAVPPCMSLLPIVDQFLRWVVVLTVSSAKLYAEDKLKNQTEKHRDLARIP